MVSAGKSAVRTVSTMASRQPERSTRKSSRKARGLSRERHGEKVPGGLLGRVVLWTAEAKELKWQRLGVVARFPRTLGQRRDITYAWMAPLGGDNWFTVFYCGLVHGPSDIYGLRMRIAEPK